MASEDTSSGKEGASERDAVYERLMSRTDLGGLDDRQALDYVGELTDLSVDLCRRAGLERAVSLSEELQRRDLSDEVRATSQYFLGNAWASLRSLAERDQQAWEQPELEREVFHYRMALRDEATSHALPKQRAAQILTNLGNTMSEVGRPVEAVEYWNRALMSFPAFPMAIGNRGYGLYRYASYVHDDGHRALMMKLAHTDLREALSPERRRYLQGNAAKVFAWTRAKIEGYLEDEYLSTVPALDDLPIGSSEEEIAYRRWCLDKCLFVNPINDLGPHAVAAADVMLLPGFVTVFGAGPTGPAVQGLYNQMKQEYVSARYLYYEGVTSPRSVHFSDKNVKLYDTLDYPAYSLAVEKTKAAFRMVYSITDRIAYFLKHYFRLTVADEKVSFRNVWYRGGLRRKGLEPMVERASSWPLRGLFWLGKDLYEDDPGFKDALEPDAQDLRAYRNALEHHYLKLSEELWRGSRERADVARHKALNELDDDLALLRNRFEFERKALRMLKTVRAALVYLCLAVYAEEGRRERERGSDRYVPSMEAPILDDWRKT